MAGEVEVTMGKPALTPVDFAAGRVGEIAHILALGYVRYRSRQAALHASARHVGSSEKPLDDVPPQATFATGERRTSETGGNA